MSISKMVTDLWGVQEFLQKNNQRDITEKLCNGEQPFFSTTHRLYLMHIPINLHEDIMDSERVMG